MRASPKATRFLESPLRSCTIKIRNSNCRFPAMAMRSSNKSSQINIGIKGILRSTISIKTSISSRPYHKTRRPTPPLTDPPNHKKRHPRTPPSTSSSTWLRHKPKEMLQKCTITSRNRLIMCTTWGRCGILGGLLQPPPPPPTTAGTRGG